MRSVPVRRFIHYDVVSRIDFNNLWTTGPTLPFFVGKKVTNLSVGSASVFDIVL